MIVFISFRNNYCYFRLFVLLFVKNFSSTKVSAMQNEMHELFLLAARFFYRKYKKNGGSQGELARKLGITNSYLSPL